MTDYLNLDVDNTLKISPSDMVGKMIGVMGSTGSGKKLFAGGAGGRIVCLHADDHR